MIFASMGWNPEVLPFFMAENSSPPTPPCVTAKSAAFEQLEFITGPTPRSSGKFDRVLGFLTHTDLLAGFQPIARMRRHAGAGRCLADDPIAGLGLRHREAPRPHERALLRLEERKRHARIYRKTTTVPAATSISRPLTTRPAPSSDFTFTVPPQRSSVVPDARLSTMDE